MEAKKSLNELFDLMKQMLSYGEREVGGIKIKEMTHQIDLPLTTLITAQPIGILYASALKAQAHYHYSQMKNAYEVWYAQKFAELAERAMADNTRRIAQATLERIMLVENKEEWMRWQENIAEASAMKKLADGIYNTWMTKGKLILAIVQDKSLEWDTISAGEGTITELDEEEMEDEMRGNGSDE